MKRNVITGVNRHWLIGHREELDGDTWKPLPRSDWVFAILNPNREAWENSGGWAEEGRSLPELADGEILPASTFVFNCEPDTFLVNYVGPMLDYLWEGNESE